jgi:hypothetical protein
MAFKQIKKIFYINNLHNKNLILFINIFKTHFIISKGFSN